jgi:4-amino-4-deoxy-L-arabinose transferase-like glycosyltransferase
MPPRLKLVLFLAFMLRSALALAVWLLLQDATAFYAKDTGSYLQPAIELATAGSFTTYGTPELFRTPGYPLLLSVAVWFGQVEIITIALQILLGCGTVYLVFLLANELFADARSATWSALSFSLEPLSLLSSNWLLSDALFTTLLAAALYCLIHFINNRNAIRLWLAALLFAAAVYVRPIGYFLPLVLTLTILLWGIRKREKKLVFQSLLFCAISFALIGAWQLRNKIQTGYAGFSSAVEYNLYFHQVAALRARELQLPFYQVMNEMGFYSREQYLCQNPEQQNWPVAQQYEFMRNEGVKATWRNPLAAANIYLHGLVISLFDPGASEYLRLFRLYPKSGRTLNGVVSDGIIATTINLITTKPLLCTLTVGLGLMLLLYYGFSLLGLKACATQQNLALWLLLTTGIYLLALSGGTLAASRFRLPVMIIVCVLAGQGVAIVMSRLQFWKEPFVSGYQLGTANLHKS